MDQCIVQIDIAMPAGFPIVIHPFAELVPSITEHGTGRRHGFGLQRSDGHGDFEGRPWGVLPLRSAIVQWASFVLHDFHPLLRSQFSREHVGVEAGTAGHGQNITAGRIQRHDGAAFFAQQIFGNLLEPHINGEIEVVPRLRLLDDRRFLLMPECIDLHALLTGHSPHVPIIGLFHAILPHDAALMEIDEFWLFQLVR